MKNKDESNALEVCLLAMKTIPERIKDHLDISDQAFNDLFMAVYQELNPEEPPDPEPTDEELLGYVSYYKVEEDYDLT